MICFRIAMRTSLLATFLGLGACGLMPMKSDTESLTGHLSGSSEVPPVTTTGAVPSKQRSTRKPSC